MDWQPMETAPKDGTRVLLADHTEVAIGRYVSETGRTLVADDEPYWEPFDFSRWELERDDWFEPTNWQPLPTPPSQT